MNNSQSNSISTKLSQIVHDMRSPLQAIKSISQGMVSDEKKQEEFLSSASIRLEELISSLNNITNDLNDQKEKELVSPCELNQILHETSSIKYIEYPFRRFKIKVAQNKIDSNILVKSDELKRLLSNFLNNAIEALGENGKIKILLSETKDNVKIEIKDNGHGMPKELLSRIGDLGITFNKKNGSGLGIYSAKKTIESWNGKLDIDSLLGVGTIITITLPKAKKRHLTLIH